MEMWIPLSALMDIYFVQVNELMIVQSHCLTMLDPENLIET